MSRHWAEHLLPLPPASHLVNSNQEASEQIPQPIEETGQDIGQAEVCCDVDTHDAVEDHEVERAVDDEDIPAYGKQARKAHQQAFTNKGFLEAVPFSHNVHMFMLMCRSASMAAHKCAIHAKRYTQIQYCTVSTSTTSASSNAHNQCSRCHVCWPSHLNICP